MQHHPSPGVDHSQRDSPLITHDIGEAVSLITGSGGLPPSGGASCTQPSHARERKPSLAGEDDENERLPPTPTVLDPLHVEGEGVPPPRLNPHEYKATLARIWPTTDPLAWPEECRYRAIYDEVRRYNLPNYLGAKITVPSALNLLAWENDLADYQDRDVCVFLRYGWPSSYTGRDPPVASLNNHSTAEAHAIHSTVLKFDSSSSTLSREKKRHNTITPYQDLSCKIFEHLIK